MLDWIWGIVGAIVGTVVGIAGATIGAWNSKRMARGEESFLKMKKWNIYDSFCTLMIVAGLLFLIGGVLSIWFEMMNDAYAISILSLALLFIGCLNSIIRLRALQTKT